MGTPSSQLFDNYLDGDSLFDTVDVSDDSNLAPKILDVFEGRDYSVERIRME